MDSNQFDTLGHNPDFSDDDKRHFDRLDYLVHKTFAQTESGAELLAIWSESLTMSSVLTDGNDLVSIGHAEGVKSVIRNIILTIRKVENE